MNNFPSMHTLNGTDDRLEYHACTPDIQDKAASVAAIYRDFNIITPHPLIATSAQLQTVVFSVRRRLCSNVRFRDQPTGALGTAFLVAPKIIATAQHNIMAFRPALNAPPDVTKMKFVFNYFKESQNENNDEIVTVDNNDIFTGKSLVAQDAISDWALIELDRNVPNSRPPLKIRKNGKVDKNESVYILGYPCGLPLKYADNATITENSEDRFFLTSLDAFNGNSGSPVFGKSTHNVEGILVSGASDFEWSAPDQCEFEKRSSSGREKCARITALAAHIP